MKSTDRVLKIKYLRYEQWGIKIGPLAIKTKGPGEVEPTWTQEG
jgi:hypothetical protein